MQGGSESRALQLTALHGWAEASSPWGSEAALVTWRSPWLPHTPGRQTALKMMGLRPECRLGYQFLTLHSEFWCVAHG